MLNFKKMFVGGVAVAAMTLGTQTAKAVVVEGGPVAGPTTELGTGLNGEFFRGADSTLDSETTIGVLGGEANATFTSLLVDYPNGTGGGDRVDPVGSTDLNTFLGSDGASILGDAGGAGLTNTVFRFSGLINITADMDQDTEDGQGDIDVNFDIFATTGTNSTTVRLTLGGTVIAEGGATSSAFSSPAADGVAEFASEGLYEIELLFMRNSSGSQIGIQGNINDIVLTANLGEEGSEVGLLFLEAPGGGGVIPAPAALPAGMALLGMLGMRRNRRRS